MTKIEYLRHFLTTHSKRGIPLITWTQDGFATPAELAAFLKQAAEGIPGHWEVISHRGAVFNFEQPMLGGTTGDFLEGNK